MNTLIPLPGVTKLDLSDNDINSCGRNGKIVDDLAYSLEDQPIVELNLRGNCFDDRDIGVLARVLKNKSLTKLDLSGNCICSEGAATLATALIGSSLTELDLNDNMIGIEGAKALLRVLKESSLQTLKIFGNRCSDDCGEAFEKVLQPLDVKASILFDKLCEKYIAKDMLKYVDMGSLWEDFYSGIWTACEAIKDRREFAVSEGIYENPPYDSQGNTWAVQAACKNIPFCFDRSGERKGKPTKKIRDFVEQEAAAECPPSILEPVVKTGKCKECSKDTKVYKCEDCDEWHCFLHTMIDAWKDRRRDGVFLCRRCGKASGLFVEFM